MRKSATQYPTLPCVGAALYFTLLLLHTFISTAVTTGTNALLLRDVAEHNTIHDVVSKTNSSQSTRLVLSYFFGYDIETRSRALHLYLGSLRATGSGSRVVVVYDGGFCQEVADLYGAECVRFHTLPSHKDLEARKAGQVERRFVYWIDFLQSEAAESVQEVLLTDFRDVVFQFNDPFDHVPRTFGSGLTLFSEDSNILSGEDKTLMGKCERCASMGVYGSERICHDLSGLPLINIGIFFGQKHVVSANLKIFGEALQGTRYRCWDQYVFAALLWSGTLQGELNIRVAAAEKAKPSIPIIIAFGETSGFCTVGAGPSLESDSAGRVVDHEGNPCLLVHQYDRWALLAHYFRNIYDPKTQDWTGAKQSSQNLSSLHSQSRIMSPVRLNETCNSPFRIRRPFPGSRCEGEMKDDELRKRKVDAGKGIVLLQKHYPATWVQQGFVGFPS